MDAGARASAVLVPLRTVPFGAWVAGSLRGMRTAGRTPTGRLVFGGDLGALSGNTHGDYWSGECRRTQYIRGILQLTSGE